MFTPHPARLPPAPAAGLAVADVDGDTLPELVLAPAGGPVRVLRWGAAGLRDAAPVGPVGPAAGAVAAADLDGDGAEELYFPAGPTPRAVDRLLKLHPENHWLDLFADPAARPARGPAGGRVAAAIDRRGDGRFGFLVGGDGWPLRLVELGRDGRLADLARPLALGHVVTAGAVVAAPLTSSYTDLFVATQSGANRFFRNRGDGTFDDVGSHFALADLDEHARGAAAVGGGLAWVNWDGPHRLTVLRSSAFWNRATPAYEMPSAARGVAVADFDNDGHEELFVLNDGEPNRLFRLTPELVRLDAGAATDFPAHTAVVADIDRDGVPELLLAGADGVTVFHARAGGNWLRIVPRTRFGAPARGAAVRAGLGGRELWRAVDAGANEPVAHFGLGDGVATHVTVTWPDGSALTLRDPDPNCTYDVPYPAG